MQTSRRCLALSSAIRRPSGRAPAPQGVPPDLRAFRRTSGRFAQKFRRNALKFNRAARYFRRSPYFKAGFNSPSHIRASAQRGLQHGLRGGRRLRGLGLGPVQRRPSGFFLKVTKQPPAARMSGHPNRHLRGECECPRGRRRRAGSRWDKILFIAKA